MASSDSNNQPLAPPPPAIAPLSRTNHQQPPSAAVSPPALVIVPLSSPTFSSSQPSCSSPSSSFTSASNSIPGPPHRLGITASLDDLSDDLLLSILVVIAKSATLPPLFKLGEPSLSQTPGPAGPGIGSPFLSQGKCASLDLHLGTCDPQPSRNHGRRHLVPVQVQTLVHLSQVSRRFHSLVHDEFVWLQVYSALNAHRIVTAAPWTSPPPLTSTPTALGPTRPPLVMSSAPMLSTPSDDPAPFTIKAPTLRSPHTAVSSGQGSASRGLQVADFPGSWLALVRDLIRIDKTWRLKQFDVVHVELAPLQGVLGHFSSSDHTVGARVDDGKLDTAYLSMATDDVPFAVHSSASPSRPYQRGLAVLARHLIRAQSSSSESDDSEGEDEFESFPPAFSRSTYASTPRTSPIRPAKLRTIHVLDYPSLHVLANHAVYRDPSCQTFPFLPAMQVHYIQHPVPGASTFYDLTEPNSAGARGGGNALYRLLGLDLRRNRYALCYSARSDTSRCVLALVDYASDRESAHSAEKYLHSYLGIPFTEIFYTLPSGDYMLAYLSPVDPSSINLFVTIDFLSVDPTQVVAPPSLSPPSLHLIARHIVPQPAEFFYPFPDGRHVALSKLIIASANGIFSTWSFPPMHNLKQPMNPIECFSTRPSVTATGKSSLDLDVLYDKPWYRPTILNEIPSIRRQPPAGSHGSTSSSAAIDLVENAPHADPYARREWHQILVGVRDTHDPLGSNADHLLAPFNRIYELYTLPVPPAPNASRFSASPTISSTSSLASSASSVGQGASSAAIYLQPPLSAASSSPHSSSSGSGGSLNSNTTLTPTSMPPTYTSPASELTMAPGRLSSLPRATPLTSATLLSARIDEPVIWHNMAYHLYLAAHADTWARLVCLDLAAPAMDAGAMLPRPRTQPKLKPMPMLDLSRPTASRAFTHAHGQHLHTSQTQGVFACKLARDTWVQGPLGIRVARVVDRLVSVQEQERARLVQMRPDATARRRRKGTMGSPGEASAGASSGSLKTDTSMDSDRARVGQEIVGVRRGLGSGRGRRRVVGSSSSDASETEWEEDAEEEFVLEHSDLDESEEEQSDESDEVDDDADEGAFVASIQSLWVGERWDALAVVCGPALYVLQGDE